MFEYKVTSGNDQCRYFPHLQLKDKRWLDFLQPVDDVHQTVSLYYTVNCSRNGAQDVVMSLLALLALSDLFLISFLALFFLLFLSSFLALS